MKKARGLTSEQVAVLKMNQSMRRKILDQGRNGVTCADREWYKEEPETVTATTLRSTKARTLFNKNKSPVTQKLAQKLIESGIISIRHKLDPGETRATASVWKKDPKGTITVREYTYPVRRVGATPKGAADKILPSIK